MPEREKEDVLVCMCAGLPEPPTLNAIIVLSQHFNSVTMLRNNLHFPVESYPVAPRLVEVGKSCERLVAQNKGAFWKLRRFTRYCLALRGQLAGNRYKLVIIHDYLALLAFWLVRRSAGYRGLVWFNSYDVIDLKASPIGRFSLMRLVVKKHDSLFAALDFFSLPASERKPCYPIHKIKRDCFVIPNFPAIEFYRKYSNSRRKADEPVIKLIYQGALGRGHGFEKIIPFLKNPIRGRPLHLYLKGWIMPEYKQELTKLAADSEVQDRLSFAEFGPYPTVPELASTCTIGLAIFCGKDIMNTTLGTASNKIYEYAALGLPVILYDTPHFRRHLGQKSWAFFTDLSEDSLIKTIERTLDGYGEVSAAALHDFAENFNFEKVFTPALERVIAVMHES